MLSDKGYSELLWALPGTMLCEWLLSSNSSLVWPTLNCSATTLLDVLWWWMCCGRDLGYFGLVWNHFGGCNVEGLVWDHFGGCAVEGLV